MRGKICFHSSAVCDDMKMRCNVWQLGAVAHDLLLSLTVPGALLSHSALVSCGMTLRDLVELDVGLGVLGGRNLHRLRSVEHVADGADRDGVVAGLQPLGREAVLALVVGHDRGGDGRAVLLDADEHAFHRAFLGRRHRAAERRGLRLRRAAASRPGKRPSSIRVVWMSSSPLQAEAIRESGELR